MQQVWLLGLEEVLFLLQTLKEIKLCGLGVKISDLFSTIDCIFHLDDRYE